LLRKKKSNPSYASALLFNGTLLNLMAVALRRNIDRNALRSALKNFVHCFITQNVKYTFPHKAGGMK